MKIALVLIVFVLFGLIFYPNMNIDRAPTGAKLCLSNIRALEAAVEMYNTDNDIPIDSIDAEKLKNNLSGGKLPACPKGGEYTLIKQGEWNVRCSIHGTVSELSESDKTDAEKNAEKALRLKVQILELAALMLTLIIAAIFMKKKQQNIQEGEK